MPRKSLKDKVAARVKQIQIDRKYERESLKFDERREEPKEVKLRRKNV